MKIVCYAVLQIHKGCEWIESRCFQISQKMHKAVNTDVLLFKKADTDYLKHTQTQIIKHSVSTGQQGIGEKGARGR